MAGWSFFLVFTGICFLFLAYYFSHYKFRKAGTELARGLVTQANKRPEQEKSSFILSVTFTQRSGEAFHFTATKEAEENWYAGMPVLVLYSSKTGSVEIMQVLSFRQAYARAFIFSLAGILFIVLGASIL